MSSTTATKKVLTFFDLPAELISKILIHAVLARGIKRALRLRLICKRFYQEIQPAIFASRLLDSFSTEKVLSHWYIENDHGATKFWHSYLVYRVKNERSKPLPQRRYLDIALVAERICEETGTDVEATIETLCWPALQQGTNPASNSVLEKDLQSPDLDLFCAAAYLNLMPIAKRLLQEGHSPHSESRLFSSPMRLAAWAGNAEMLELFQEHVPEFEGLDDWNSKWRGKINRASLIGAATRGDVEMVRLAIYPPSRTAPESTNFFYEAVGTVASRGNTGHALVEAQFATRNVEVYKYLQSFLRGPPARLTAAMVEHARLGNLEMVRYLLDAGADIRGYVGARDTNPLVEACRRCHGDVVELLLERGADTEFGGSGMYMGNPLFKAAQSGSLPLVRKLVSHGADLFNEDMGTEVGVFALDAAVMLEHTDMVKFLVAAGVNLEVLQVFNVGETMLQKALAKGLDSMVEILRGIGIRG